MGENIGSVARAIKNFNIKYLRIVNPRCSWPNQKALATSVGAKDILNSVKIYNSVKKSIEDLEIVFASSSRVRKVNKKIISVSNLKTKIKKGKKIGILFGPEASGLTNDEYIEIEDLDMEFIFPATIFNSEKFMAPITIPNKNRGSILKFIIKAIKNGTLSVFFPFYFFRIFLKLKLSKK